MPRRHSCLGSETLAACNVLNVLGGPDYGLADSRSSYSRKRIEHGAGAGALCGDHEHAFAGGGLASADYLAAARSNSVAGKVEIGFLRNPFDRVFRTQIEKCRFKLSLCNVALKPSPSVQAEAVLPVLVNSWTQFVIFLRDNLTPLWFNMGQLGFFSGEIHR